LEIKLTKKLLLKELYPLEDLGYGYLQTHINNLKLILLKSVDFAYYTDKLIY